MFVGLDLHKKYPEFVVMDIGDNLLRQGRIENDLEKMRRFSRSIGIILLSHRILVHKVLGTQDSIGKT